jgi:hypothetical protein
MYKKIKANLKESLGNTKEYYQAKEVVRSFFGGWGEIEFRPVTLMSPQYIGTEDYLRIDTTSSVGDMPYHESIKYLPKFIKKNWPEVTTVEVIDPYRQYDKLIKKLESAGFTVHVVRKVPRH